MAALAAVGGCTETVSGQGRQYMAPGSIEAGMVTLDEASASVHATLTDQTSQSQPPAAVAAEPESCRVAIGPASASVFTTGWAQYRLTTFQETDEVADHSVTQVVGLYPADDAAQQAYQALADGINACKSATRKDDGGVETKWAYEVRESTQSALAWTATQQDTDDWRCYRKAGLKGKALFQVSVCQAGNGAPAVDQIADTVRQRIAG